LTLLKPYSPLESRLLAAIPDDGTMISTIDLVSAAYDHEAPLAARQSVLDAAGKLIRKIDFNEEPYEIMRSKPCGPMPIYFWKRPRKTETIKEDFFASVGG
jgi:hypothetical protein